MIKPRKKKLVVFFDGTWNKADQHSQDGKPCPTNITRLFEATLAHDHQENEQIVHYVQGVGSKSFQHLIGGGFGYGISDNIKDGYKFLVSNYEDGDDIYIFGFSRGAYTARSLVGLIRNVGILTRDKLSLLDKAYEIYKNKTPDWHPNSPNSEKFKQQHTWAAERIKFLGVFDTVGALGAPFGIVLSWLVDKLFGCSFHDTQLSSIIENAYHALAIDERRLIFQPTLMTPNASHNALNFEQKWFAGVHSDIGGGYPQTGLSDFSLEWMAGKAKKHGLHLDLNKISSPKFKPDLLAEPHHSQTWFYQLSAVLFVKLPGCLGLVPDKYKITLPDIQSNGDYLRPIPQIGNAADFIGASPVNSDTSTYQGDLDVSVLNKIRQESNYQPANVINK